MTNEERLVHENYRLRREILELQRKLAYERESDKRTQARAREYWEELKGMNE